MRTWMITGISSGIGYEFTNQLLEAGECVVGTVRRMEPIQALQKKYPNTLIVYQVDIRDYDAVENFVRDAFSGRKGIDVVLSNSGIGVKGAIDEVNRQDIDDIFATNLIGAIIFIRACVPYLKMQGYGRIIQMSSINGRVPAKNWAIYNATKYGINGFCEALMLELEPWNIHVNIIEPGTVRTAYWSHSRTATKSDSDLLSEYSEKAEVDPCRMVKLIINSCVSTKLPLHIVMGERACRSIVDALRRDLVTYEKQWQLARDAKAVRRVPIGGVLSFPEGVGGRKLLMWGLGEDAKRIFEYFDWSLWDEKLYGFVEKDRDMVGKIFIGREIFHPTDVENWESFFVIVTTTKFYGEVRTALESFRLREGKDFCHWEKLRKR